jgi:polyketide cyclase/dehydrase/lipid transport protein
MPWDLREVGTDFLDVAPYRCTSTEILHRPATAIFRALAEDPAGWGAWNPGFSYQGRYLTSPPHGPGSVREVIMAGIRYTDTILLWDEPYRWTFFVSRAGAPFAGALAEDYRITPQGEGGSHCTVQWTIAMDPHPLLAKTRPLMDALLPRYFRRAMTNLSARLGASLSV